MAAKPARRPMSGPRRRMLLLLASGVVLAVAVALAAVALRDSIVFFVAPTELLAEPPSPQEKLRLGGMVEEGSLETSGDGQVNFRVTDYGETVAVRYMGVVPDLFREGQGVVAEGWYREGVFEAERILAKHDENYMPREVAESLKETGNWRGEGESAEEGEQGGY